MIHFGDLSSIIFACTPKNEAQNYIIFSKTDNKDIISQ